MILNQFEQTQRGHKTDNKNISNLKNILIKNNTPTLVSCGLHSYQILFEQDSVLANI